MGDEKQCGAPYTDQSGEVLTTCQQAPKHPHGYHRDNYLVWLELKSERAYLRGNADMEWRVLAEAVIRGLVAPGDVSNAMYWLNRLHKRANRQEAAAAMTSEYDAAHWSPE